MLIRIIFLFLICEGYSFSKPKKPLQVKHDSYSSAKIVALDKIYASSTEHTILFDKTLDSDKLEISVKNCVFTAGQGFSAWITIKGESQFSGWMFSRYPSVDFLESQRYDVKLLECL